MLSTYRGNQSINSFSSNDVLATQNVYNDYPTLDIILSLPRFSPTDSKGFGFLLPCLKLIQNFSYFPMLLVCEDMMVLLLHCKTKSFKITFARQHLKELRGYNICYTTLLDFRWSKLLATDMFFINMLNANE